MKRRHIAPDVFDETGEGHWDFDKNKLALEHMDLRIEPKREWQQLYTDAWRILRCRGRVVLFQHCLAGVAHHPASCHHAEPPMLRTFRVLACSRGKSKCVACPRFQAFRQVPQKVEGNEFFFAGKRHANAADHHLKTAQIYHRHAQAVPARVIPPPADDDFETHAILPQGVDCVDHAKHCAQQRQRQRHNLRPIHPATHTTFATGRAI